MNRSLAPDEQIRLDPRRMHSLTVAEGVLCVRLGDDDLVLTPGDRVSLPVGTPHLAWNGGDEAASVAVQVVASACPYELRLAA